MTTLLYKILALLASLGMGLTINAIGKKLLDHTLLHKQSFKIAFLIGSGMIIGQHLPNYIGKYIIMNITNSLALIYHVLLLGTVYITVKIYQKY